MEGYPFPLPESASDPEKAGNKDTSKKKEKLSKKKTAVIPREVIEEAAGKEVKESKSSKVTRVPRGILEPESKETKEDDGAKKTDESTVEQADSTTAETEAESAESEITFETEDSTGQSEIADEPVEMVDDEEPPVIFDRSEATPGAAEIKPVSHTGSGERAVPEPQETPKEENAPEIADFIQNPAESEPETAPPTPETEPVSVEAPPVPPPFGAPVEAIAAPVYYEDIPAGMPLEARAAMFDPSDGFGESATPVSHKAEAVKPLVTEKDVEDAYHQGKKRGNSRGVLSGGIAGFWLGRRGKKEAVAKAQAETKQKEAEVKKVKNDQALIEERLRQMEEAKKQFPEHEIHNYYRQESVPQPNATQESTPEPREFSPAISVVAAETLLSQPESKEMSDSPKKPELPPEEQEITEDTYKAPEGRRIEMSAWHAIEVDDKTGKAVENPERGYGEEFKREQQQEKLHQDAVKAQAAALLGQAVIQTADVAGGQGTGTGQSDTSDNKGKKSVWSDTKYIKQQLVRRTLDPVTWVIALLLVVLLFIFVSR